MANTFVSKVANNVTTVTTVYTCPSATSAVVTSILVCNDAGTDGTVTVSLYKSNVSTTVNISSSAPLPANSNFNALATNNRMNMEAGDYITVTASQASDVVISAMQIT